MSWHRDTLTVGVEEEFHIVDRRTGVLANGGEQLVAALEDIGGFASQTITFL